MTHSQRPSRPFVQRLLVVLAVVLVWALGWGWGGAAQAKTITIVQATRLEFRNETAPGGTGIEEFVVIVGSPAIVRVDNDQIEANRIEYNKTRRYLQVVGEGVFRGEKDNVAGRDFRVTIDDNGLAGEDVLIATKELDVQGLSVERLPGQLDVLQGYFSPCGRCGKEVNAYAFRAEELTIYPGDRLVAKGVTLLIAEQPIMYLPFVVILLSDPNRQPRFEANFGDGLPPTTPNILLDWPFFTGDFGLGFLMARYFEKRQPAFSFGVDYSAYNLLGFDNKSRAYFLLEPPLAGDNTGAYFNYLLETTGSLELNPGADIEDRLPSLDFSVRLYRLDQGQSKYLPVPAALLFGGGLVPVSRFSALGLEFGMKSQNWNWALVANGVLDHGYTMPSSTRQAALQQVQYLPEFRLQLSGEALPKLGPFSLSRFGLSVGYILAPANLYNPSARAAKDSNGLIGAGRVVIEHGINLNWEPWSGANLTGSSSFRGAYYSTRNNPSNSVGLLGTLERNVQFSASLGFTQSLWRDGSTDRLVFGLRYSYSILEGESPFAFDSVAFGRSSIQEQWGYTLAFVPFNWATFGANGTYSPRLSVNRWSPTAFTASLRPDPLEATLGLLYDFARLEPVSWNATLGNTVRAGVGFSVSTGYRYRSGFGLVTAPNLQAGFNDLVFRVGYRNPDNRFSVSVTLLDNLNNGEIRSWSLGSSFTFGDGEDAWVLGINESFVPPQYSNTTPVQPYARLFGDVSLYGTGWRLQLNHAFDFSPWTDDPGNIFDAPPSSLNLSYSNFGNSDLAWNVALGSNVDLPSLRFYNTNITASLQWNIDENSRLGASANLNLSPSRPNLSSNVSYNAPGFSSELSLLLNLPNPNWNTVELSNFSVLLAWQITDWFGVGGRVVYQRNNNYAGNISDSLGFFGNSGVSNGLDFTFAMHLDDGEKPNLFLTLRLVGSYTWTTNGTQNPGFTDTKGGTVVSAFVRPVFIVTLDMCCYAIQLELDTSPAAGLSFSLRLAFPGELPQNGRAIVTIDPSGTRFPILPFLPVIK